MCGIACIINKNNTKVKEEDIQRMNEMMTHRGPDAEGMYLDNNVGFGHRRLSIVGLSESGNQPMVSQDGKLVLIYNGEIYNYVELKEQLSKDGAHFVTDTDTEMILEAYNHWGTDCTQYFNGMWSFALYDICQKIIFISRDRFGVKPLYYYESETELIFASEIKCITAIRPEQKIVDVTQVARYLAGIQEDADERTFYQNIHNFPKSCNMIYEINTGKKGYHKYWEIDILKFKEKWKCENPYKKFAELIEDSIKIRLRADVKIGASLSGGLDSSTIVGIIRKKFKITVNTFSSVYKEKNCNEKEFIDYMNEYADGIPHYIYPDKSENLMQDIKELIYYHDGPCHSASPYSGYCVYKDAQKEVKVLLDGQGADELFGGYFASYNAKLKELLRKDTWISKIKAVNLIFSIEKLWPERVGYLFDDELILKTLGIEGYKEIRRNIKNGNAKERNNVRLEYQEKFKKIDLKNKLPKNKFTVNELDKELIQQFQYTMLPRILHDVDRNSMARSLEVRLPFLDYRLVEFSYVISDEYKIRGSWTKYIIRKSCKKYLPKKIYTRRNKMGFPAPFDKWIKDERFKNNIKEYLDAFKDRKIVDENSLEKYYQAHISGEINGADSLFRIMSLEIWLQSEIDTPSNRWIYKAEGKNEDFIEKS